jgi:hypothetical protein
MNIMQIPKILCAILCLTSTVAMGCQPSDPEFWEDSAKRVKSNFEGAQFVVVAHVITLEKVWVQASRESNFRREIERATFRVAHRFKGSLKPGDTFKVDSGLSSCSRRIVDAQWVPFIPGKKRAPYPKRWLIYYTQPPVVPGPGPQFPPFEITSSPLSRPADRAQYDIDVLRASASKWRSGRSGRNGISGETPGDPSYSPCHLPPHLYGRRPQVTGIRDFAHVCPK